MVGIVLFYDPLFSLLNFLLVDFSLSLLVGLSFSEFVAHTAHTRAGKALLVCRTIGHPWDQFSSSQPQTA